MNTNETYRLAGEKAGTAARRHDTALMMRQNEWLARALTLELSGKRGKLRAIYDAAYREAFKTY